MRYSAEILLVDDDAVTLQTMKRILEDAGYRTRCAATAIAALAELQSAPCQLVVSDWVMPQLTGLDFCREVRKRGADGGPYVFFILLTSRTSPEDVASALGAGVDEYIRKPVAPSELLARVRTGERLLSLISRDATIIALASLAESRDSETGEHVKRVQRMSRIVAQAVTEQGHEDADADFADLIYLASALHDIGKVAIPDSILLKPGRLTEEEFEAMKTHTIVGARCLDAAIAQAPTADYLRMARDIALTHHERYDGGGYPDGLTGADIPLAGRVVALVDVYDALTTRRCYKAAAAHESARAYIQKERGKHFDPDVVDAFMATQERLREINHLYGTEAPTREAA